MCRTCGYIADVMQRNQRETQRSLRSHVSGKGGGNKGKGKGKDKDSSDISDVSDFDLLVAMDEFFPSGDSAESSTSESEKAADWTKGKGKNKNNMGKDAKGKDMEGTGKQTKATKGSKGNENNDS